MINAKPVTGGGIHQIQPIEMDIFFYISMTCDQQNRGAKEGTPVSPQLSMVFPKSSNVSQHA